MVRRSKTSKKAIEAALRKTLGNITQAARLLGVHRNGLMLRIAKEESLREIVTEARESILDNAESAIAAAVANREPWAVRLVLITLGRSRGYSLRVEREGDPREPLGLPSEEPPTEEELRGLRDTIPASFEPVGPVEGEAAAAGGAAT